MANRPATAKQLHLINSLKDQAVKAGIDFFRELDYYNFLALARLERESELETGKSIMSISEASCVIGELKEAIAKTHEPHQLNLFTL